MLRLSAFVPESAGARDAVQALGRAGTTLSIPAVVASTLAATTYGDGLIRTVRVLEGREPSAATLTGRLRVTPYLIAFPVAVAVMLSVLGALPDALGAGTQGRILGIYLTFVVGWLFAASQLMLLYRLFSGSGGRWRGIIWSSLAAGSFLAGMTMGWVLVLQFGLTVGQAFGGSETVGRVVLFVVYLLLFQVTVLVGYVLKLQIDALSDD